MARTISGKVMTAVASAAPAEVNARRMPNADSSHAPTVPRVPKTSSRNVADGHRRQHQREMHNRIEHCSAEESRPRQRIRDDDRQRKAE
jgi:hypothetical protein